MKIYYPGVRKAQVNRQIKAKRLRAAARQEWKCFWCGCLMCRVHGCPQQLTIDHRIPKHNGGTLRAGNYVAACFKCNSERHPEMNQFPKSKSPIVASSGETKSESPFAKLKELVK